MTRIKNLPVAEQELLQWITAWRSNRELAFSAMPDTLYAYLRQEEIIDQDWELTDRGRTILDDMANYKEVWLV